MASVRQQSPGGAPRLADLVPGEIVWAKVINGVENPLATGKSRPVILIEPDGYAWRSMGLTTNPRYRDGMPRVPVPNPRAVGLKRPGWLWGSRLLWTSGLDILDHIGWVDLDLVFEVLKLADIDGAVGKHLLTAAREHHGAKPRPELRLLPGGFQ